MYEKKTEETRCHVERKFSLFDGKWNIMIICAMQDEESIRFSKLKSRLPNISDMTLSNALKNLTDNGIIERFAYNEIPPRVEYRLSEKGKSLIPSIRGICLWSYNCENEEHSEIMKHCWKFLENQNSEDSKSDKN